MGWVVRRSHVLTQETLEPFELSVPQQLIGNDARGSKSLHWKFGKKLHCPLDGASMGLLRILSFRSLRFQLPPDSPTCFPREGYVRGMKVVFYLIGMTSHSGSQLPKLFAKAGTEPAHVQMHPKSNPLPWRQFVLQRFGDPSRDFLTTRHPKHDA